MDYIRVIKHRMQRRRSQRTYCFVTDSIQDVVKGIDDKERGYAVWVMIQGMTRIVSLM